MNKARKLARSRSVPHHYVCKRRPLTHVPLCAGDAARSVKNIAEWNTYLPSDCVRTMVRMGWDYTT
jgi:hypothetical protein